MASTRIIHDLRIRYQCQSSVQGISFEPAECKTFLITDAHSPDPNVVLNARTIPHTPVQLRGLDGIRILDPEANEARRKGAEHHAYWQDLEGKWHCLQPTPLLLEIIVEYDIDDVFYRTVFNPLELWSLVYRNLIVQRDDSLMVWMTKSRRLEPARMEADGHLIAQHEVMAAVPGSSAGEVCAHDGKCAWCCV